MDRILDPLCVVLLGLALVSCSDDDGPTNPGDVGSASNPEPVTVGTPVTGAFPGSGRYYLVFATAAAGD